MKNLRIAMRLVRMARMLLAGSEPNAPASYSAGTSYSHITGDFKHPSKAGFWAKVDDATFTVTPTGLDWKDGEWKDGEWLDGSWRNGWWMSGKWHAGDWLGGAWFGGYDGKGEFHDAGDSPDKWNKRVRLTQRPGNGQTRSNTPMPELFGTPIDQKKNGITPDMLFGEDEKEIWVLRDKSDPTRRWGWRVTKGSGIRDIKEEFGNALDYHNIRMRLFWIIKRKSDTQYSIYDDNGKERYTFTKARNKEENSK